MPRVVSFPLLDVYSKLARGLITVEEFANETRGDGLKPVVKEVGVLEMSKREDTRQIDIDGIVVERIIDVIARAISTDRKAVEILLSVRVPCSEDLTQDPSIQTERDADGDPILTVKGLLAGIAGCHEGGEPKLSFVYRTEDEKHRPSFLLGVESVRQ